MSEDSFTSLLNPAASIPLPPHEKSNLKSKVKRARPAKAPIIATNNPSLRPSGKKRLEEARRIKNGTPKLSTSLSSFLPSERNRKNSLTVSNELRTLYWHLGKSRTFAALLPTLRHYPHLSDLTLAEIQTIAEENKWESWVEAMDHQVDTRIATIEVEKNVKCVTDLRNIAGEMIERFKARMDLTPEYCIINRPADLVAVAKVLVTLADRNPDGTKRSPSQVALGSPDAVRNGMTALGDATGRLISGLSESEGGRKVLDALGEHLKAVAQDSPGSDALDAEFEPIGTAS